MSTSPQPHVMDSPDQLRYLQRVFDHSNNGIMVFRAVRDADNRIVDFEWVMANRKAGELAGKPADELVGKRILVEMPETLSSTLFDQYVRVIETGEMLEYDHHHKYGSFEPWLHVTASKLDDGFVAMFSDVSQQKRLQDELVAQHDELERFFSLAIEMLCITNTDGYFLKVNKAWEDVLGYNTAEIESRNILDFVHPDDVEATIQRVGELKDQKPVISFINRYRHKDGSYRFLEWRGIPRGNLIYGAARDVTQRQELETHQAQLAAIVDSSLSGIIGKNLNDEIIAWNPGAEAIYGYKAEEIIGQTIDRLVPADRFQELAAHLERVKQGSTVERYETVRIRKDGTRVNVALTISPIKDKYNRVIGVSTINQDIGALKQVQDALRESEARYRAIVDTMTEGVLLQLGDGTIQAINASAERILGLTLDQMMRREKVDFEWRTIHEDGTAFPTSELPHIMTLSQGIPQSNVIMGVVKGDNPVTWILVNSQPLFQPNTDTPYAAVSTFVDITDRKQSEQQRLRLELEKERVKLLAGFIEKSSHEFRTPLTVMQSSLAVMMGTDNEEKRQQKASIIEAQIDGLTRLVDMLQRMSQLDSRSTLEFGTGDVNEMVEEVVSRFKVAARSANITLQFEPAERLANVFMSEEHLEEALWQLMDNAIRHTPPEGKVTVCTGQQDNKVMITVRDTGEGIPADILPRIFERFYRRDQAHSTPGFGLGLPIAQSVATKHGGKITVESEVGKGSVFTISLPAVG